MEQNREFLKNIDIKNLSLGEYRDIKNFSKMMDVIEDVTSKLTAQTGEHITFFYFHHMVAYLTFCVKANKFPALTNCWKKLMPLFLKSTYEHKILVYCWMLFDFPVDKDSNKVLADHYINFLLEKGDMPPVLESNAHEFLSTMKSTRLGLYQVILNSKQIIKCKEFFTGEITTLANDRGYKAGDILLTRIVSCLDDIFVIHSPIVYPEENKQMLEDKTRADLSFISVTGDDSEDYKKFMKLSSPYWMSFTYAENSIPVLLPDEYKNYYL